MAKGQRKEAILSMQTITTIQGDTWDTLARRAYGDECKAQLLMEARENIGLLDIQIFSGGVLIAVPDELKEKTDDRDLPAWRK